MTEVEKLGDGLIIQYESVKGVDTRELEIQLHFSYKMDFSPQKDSSLSDVENATRGLLDSIEEVEEWINTHGMPSRIYGYTKTLFLLRILEHCNFTVAKLPDYSTTWSFELNTKGMKPNDLISALKKGITDVMQEVLRLKNARKNST